MPHLILAFCSLHPDGMSSTEHALREIEYLGCLRQLLRVKPKAFDLIVMENTVGNFDRISNEALRSLLSEQKIVFIPTNEGSLNKGVGELHMLNVACELGLLDNYDKVCYLTARRFITCPYVFERTEASLADAVISNPDFCFLRDGAVETVEKKEMYNDMFFAMRAGYMKEYAKFCMENRSRMVSESINSETMLYAYVNGKGLSRTWLDHLGFIRNDWFKTKRLDDLGNYHVC